MVDFAGWSMPVQYSSIAAEHQATRNAVGVFDISHMGRLQFFGPDAAQFLDAVVTRRVADMKPEPGPLRAGVQRRRRHSRRRAGLSAAATTCDDDTPPFQWSSTPAIARRSSIGLTSRRLAPTTQHDRSTTTTTAHRDDRRARPEGAAVLAAVLRVRLRPLTRRMRYYTCATRHFDGNGCLRQPHRLHRRRRLRDHLRGRTTRSTIWERIIDCGRRRRRHGGRPRRPRHAAARSRHAALRPRTVRSDQSDPGRA